MAVRTTKKSVNFEAAFTLGDFDEVLPSGIYEVETDEELLEGVSFPAYRRVRTVIHLPMPTGNSQLTRALTIDPDDLEAAILRDRNAIAPIASNEETRPVRSDVRGEGRSSADQHAVAVAENEGMIRRAGPPGESC